MATEELDKAEGQLNEEADEDAGLRAQHGAAWNRPASAALNSSLREKVASYRCARQNPCETPAFRLVAPALTSTAVPGAVRTLQFTAACRA